MPNSNLTSQDLLALGFVDIGCWQPDGDFIKEVIDEANRTEKEAHLEVLSALYAFVIDSEVLYIGKTARSIRRRFVGYRRPGVSQVTNKRCHDNVLSAIARGTCVRIYAFTPITHIQYGDFGIDIAAGLEESLIKAFDPSWNWSAGRRRLTEEAERETEEAKRNILAEPPVAASSAALTFEITLHATYYNRGIINIPTDISNLMGPDRGLLSIRFSDGSPPVPSSINRTAMGNGSVRVVGHNANIARWFQEHCAEGDVVEARVIDAHTIELVAPST